MNDILDEDYLIKMGQLDYPIKSLTIFLIHLSEKGMEGLCAMGSTMENLVLLYNSR